MQTLENCVDNPNVVIATSICREIPRHRLPNLDQGRFSIVVDDELMFIADVVAAGAQLSHRFVVVVQDGVVAKPVGVGAIV